MGKGRQGRAAGACLYNCKLNLRVASTLGECVRYQGLGVCVCVCVSVRPSVSPRLCYVSGVGVGVRGGVAGQSLAALKCVCRAPGVLGAGFSRKPTLGSHPHAFTCVRTHTLQGTLGLQEERRGGLFRAPLSPLLPTASPQEGPGQAPGEGNRS